MECIVAPHCIIAFVTLSDYTKNARRYLNATPIIREINGPEFVDLILKYYSLFDEKYRRMISLSQFIFPSRRTNRLAVNGFYPNNICSGMGVFDIDERYCSAKRRKNVFVL